MQSRKLRTEEVTKVNNQIVHGDELNDTDILILNQVEKGMGEDRLRYQKQIADVLNLNPGYISNEIKKLEELDLIERKTNTRENRLALTGKGAISLLNMDSGTPDKPKDILRLHKFTVKFPVLNKTDLKAKMGENWNEKVMSTSEIEPVINPSNDVVSHRKKDYRIALSKNNLIIQLDEIYGSEPDDLVMEAYLKTFRKANVEAKELGVEINSDFASITWKISNQHLAIMKDPLSELVQESDAIEGSLTVEDSEGQKRFFIDDSDGKHELEAGTHFGEHGMARKDINTLLKLYGWVVENPVIVENFKEWAEENFSET